MRIRCSNVNNYNEWVTVFGKLNSGRHCAIVKARDALNNPGEWTNTEKEVIACIHPSPAQLEEIIDALNSGALSLRRLSGIGGQYGDHIDLNW